MTIEFNCPHCSHFLTTEDEKAGRSAKCPGCGNQIEIPAAPAGTDAGGGNQWQDTRDTGDGDQWQGAGGTDDLPALVPATGVPASMDVGDVFSISWTIFKDQMGLVLGGVVIAGIITQIAQLPAQVANQVMSADGVDDEVRIIAFGAYLVFLVISWLVQMYMTCGTTLLLLNVVKGRPAEITDIFRGGRYYGRMLLCSFVLGLMAFLGFLACIVPAIIISLMFYPFASVLVDRDVPGLDALWQARDLTSGHKMNLFVLFLAIFGITLLGFMACCVGLIFTTPLVTLMGTVAYMRMSGQQTIAG